MGGYRLQSLLALRRQAREAAARTLAEAAAALEDAQRRHQALFDALRRGRDERESGARAHALRVEAHGGSAAELTVRGQWEERQRTAEGELARALARQAGAVALAARALALRQEEHARAVTEAEVLERHRERWVRARQAEGERREEATLDEVAQGLFQALRRR